MSWYYDYKALLFLWREVSHVFIIARRMATSQLTEAHRVGTVFLWKLDSYVTGYHMLRTNQPFCVYP